VIVCMAHECELVSMCLCVSLSDCSAAPLEQRPWLVQLLKLFDVRSLYTLWRHHASTRGEATI
jgi:hypothetical protein